MVAPKDLQPSRAPSDLPLTSPQLVNVHQAKTHLSQLLHQVEQGQEVAIARSGVADCATGGLAPASPGGGGARGDARPDQAGR
jgi:hypothetical protein